MSHFKIQEGPMPPPPTSMSTISHGTVLGKKKKKIKRMSNVIMFL